MTPAASLTPRAVSAPLGVLLLGALTALAAALPDDSRGQSRTTTLTLFSRSLDGGTPTARPPTR